MKKTLLVLGLMLVFALGAFATNQSLTLSSAHTVNGQTLAPGNYDVKTTVKGSTAEVTWSKDGKKVATATGQVVQADKKSNYDSFDSEAGVSGAPAVKSLRFRGSNTVVQFDTTATASGK